MTSRWFAVRFTALMGAFLAFAAPALALPDLTDVQPRTINTGLTTTIRAIGSGFVAGSEIYWGSTPLATVLVSSSELRATHTPTETAYDSVGIRVKNPGAGAGDSGIQNVTIIPPIVVRVGPPSGTLTLGMQFSFGSYVGNAQNPLLQWSVNGIAGGNATVGTINAGGVYTTPAVLPSPNAVTISAASAQDPRQFATATMTLLNPAPLFTDVQPRLSNLGIATTFRLMGYRFAPGAEVFWNGQAVTATFVSENEVRITHTPTEAADSRVPLWVRNQNSGGTDSARQEVWVGGTISVQIAPPAATLQLGETAPFYAGVKNSWDQAVTWSVNNVPGGNPTIGTITSQGVYTAPSIFPASTAILIKAASAANPGAEVTASVTLRNTSPLVSGVTPSALTEATTNFTIHGSGFSPNATATLDGQLLAVTVVSPSQINVTGASVSFRPGGFALLRVGNPDPAGQVSPTFGVPVTVSSAVLSYASAARFLEQASWGPTPASVARVMKIGRDAWITEQFAAPASSYVVGNGEPDLSSLKSQFMRNAVQGDDQLRQRVAFAWGQIFVVSGVRMNEYSQMAPYQRMLLNSAFGNFRTLLRDVTLSPSMGEFLDMVNNDKPYPSLPVAPNENYARELLQLFTMGPGSYTEADIKQLALALTGWTYPPSPASSSWPNPSNYEGEMVAFDSHHDSSAKTILGVTIPAGQTAKQDLDAALDIIFNHPNVPQFVSYRLIQRLVTGNPSPAYVNRVAAVFVNNGMGVRGDLRAIVRAILLDPEAATDDVTTLSSDQGHLREPVLYILAMLRGLGATLPADTQIANLATTMGQDLFYPPTVFNYFLPSYRIPGTNVAGPEFQIHTGANAVARANFAILATHGVLNGFAAIPLDRFDELAGDVPQLLDAISNAFYRGQMQADMRSTITGAISDYPDSFTRARTALFLAVSHARYQAQR